MIVTPSRDDPRWPLFAAARWMTLAGAIDLSFSLLFILAGLGAMMIGLPGVVLLGGGTMFLVCASSVRRHRRWAFWLGIVLGLLLGLGWALLLTLVVAGTGWRDLLRLKAPVELSMSLLLFLLTFVHAMIVYHLARAFDALRLPPLMFAGGFEPIVPTPPPPQPVLPLEAADAPPPAR